MSFADTKSRVYTLTCQHDKTDSFYMGYNLLCSEQHVYYFSRFLAKRSVI
jgi:hypothetical protein